jgi:cytidine deaminase
MKNMNPEELYAQAATAAEHAYAPYSHFRVGAALLLTTGEVVTGTNVENASYGLTLCAERTALVRAIAEYGPQIRVAAVAITNLNGAASPPCGACRQVLAEFTEPNAPILFPGEKGPMTVPFKEIHPFSFSLK